jgi:ribonuclease VapC
LGESEAEPFARAIASDPKRLISTFTALETAIVIEAKKGESGGRELDLLLHQARIEMAPMTAEQFEIARSAWRRYGKRRPPAGLNIGDCCSYALAKCHE